MKTYLLTIVTTLTLIAPHAYAATDDHADIKAEIAKWAKVVRAANLQIQ